MPYQWRASQRVFVISGLGRETALEGRRSRKEEGRKEGGIISDEG